MDDQQKQCVMIAVLAFNITVIAVMLSLWGLNVFSNPASLFSEYGTRAVVSIIIGAVVAGIAYFGASMAQK